MRIPLRHPQDLNELIQRAHHERDAKQRDRYRVARWALEGYSSSWIAQRLDRSRVFVQKWAYAYRDGGIEAIAAKRQPGQRPKLPRDHEQAFRQRMCAGSTEADGGVCTLRGRDAARVLREEFGVGYSLGGAIGLLHRLGLSCLKPRPRHRKNDPQAVAAWKQDAPLL